MKLSFREWLDLQERPQNESSYGNLIGVTKSLAGLAANVTADALGVPGMTELGMNTDNMGVAAKMAAKAVGLHDMFVRLNPEQLKGLRDRCYNKRTTADCNYLCRKSDDKKACGIVGITKVGRGRRLVQNPFKGLGR